MPRFTSKALPSCKNLSITILPQVNFFAKFSYFFIYFFIFIYYFFSTLLHKTPVSLSTLKEKLCESINSTLFLFSADAGVFFIVFRVTNGNVGFIAHAFIQISPSLSFFAKTITSVNLD